LQKNAAFFTEAAFFVMPKPKGLFHGHVMVSVCNEHAFIFRTTEATDQALGF